MPISTETSQWSQKFETHRDISSLGKTKWKSHPHFLDQVLPQNKEPLPCNMELGR